MYPKSPEAAAREMEFYARKIAWAELTPEQKFETVASQSSPLMQTVLAWIKGRTRSCPPAPSGTSLSRTPDPTLIST